MSKIAIIGCGAFGATISLKLQEIGYQVTVFERMPSPLLGASYNNQNRLHLGYHYPRDIETARQCIKGFSAFKNRFPNCIVSNFPNAYFIAKEGSKVSAQDYLKFCDTLGINYEIVDYNKFYPLVKNTSVGVLTEEVVYDSKALGLELHSKLKELNVDIRFNTEVLNIKTLNDKFILELSNGQNEIFDIVVNSTYASISRLAGALGLKTLERQYEYTIVPIIETPFEKVGITVMDGAFMTVLPFGSSENHLLYHVEHTVVESIVDTHLPREWLDKETSPFAKIDAERIFNDIKSASEKFVPDLKDAKLKGFLHGPRMVLARRDDTDARPSIIDNPINNYYSVFSGKIDHCMWVADEIAEAIKSK